MLRVSFDSVGGKKQRLEFDKDSIVIGRASGSDVLLEEVRGVSRFHARITVKNKQAVVNDLGSTNGTIVNGRRVTATSVGVQDVVIIGDCKLTIYYCDRDSSKKRGNSASGIRNLGLKAEPTRISTTSNFQVQRREADFWSSLSGLLSSIWSHVSDEGMRSVAFYGGEEIHVENSKGSFRLDEKLPTKVIDAVLNRIADYGGIVEEAFFQVSLPNGIEATALLDPHSQKPILLLRAIANKDLSITTLVRLDCMSSEMLSYVSAMLSLKKTLLISGGTQSGKTTLLRLVTDLVPEDHRICAVDSHGELSLSRDDVIALSTAENEQQGAGLTTAQLAQMGVAFAPDRLVVSDLQGIEIREVLFAARRTSCPLLASVVAGSAVEALVALEQMAVAGTGRVGFTPLRSEIASSVDYVLHLEHYPDGTRRVTNIAEVRGLDDSKEYQIEDIFSFREVGYINGVVQGVHTWTGTTPNSFAELVTNGFEDVVKIFKDESS